MISLDYSSFDAALKRRLAYTKKDIAEVLNEQAKYVVINAARYTRQASADAIQKKLTTETITRTTSKTGKTLKKAKIVAYKPTIDAYKIINARQKALGLKGLNNADMSKAVQLMIARRRSAVGFASVIGWANALQQLGGRGFGRTGSNAKKDVRFARSSAATGGAQLATDNRPTVTFWNRVSFITKIGGLAALQQALNFQAGKMMRRVEDKLAGRWTSD